MRFNYQTYVCIYAYALRRSIVRYFLSIAWQSISVVNTIIGNFNYIKKSPNIIADVHGNMTLPTCG